MDRVTRIGMFFLWALAFAALSVGCGDILPPSTPKNLVANATSASAIHVSWDNSTARTGIKEYRVYRDGSFNTATNATSYDDTGLMNSTEYCYKVQAVDEDGNRSDKSDKDCDTTFDKDDSEDPTAPSNLIANVIGPTQIDLTWTESTDDTGIARYDIYRNSVFTNSSIVNSYSDVGLSNTTNYCYFVNAVDIVGNNSIPSNFACAMTNSVL